jgi:IS30 family transposase
VSYTHLSQKERYQIYSMLDLLLVADIAKHLGRHETVYQHMYADPIGELKTHLRC